MRSIGHSALPLDRACHPKSPEDRAPASGRTLRIRSPIGVTTIPVSRHYPRGVSLAAEATILIPGDRIIRARFWLRLQDNPSFIGVGEVQDSGMAGHIPGRAWLLERQNR